MITIGFSTREDNQKYIDYLKKTCNLKNIEVIQKVNNGEKSLSNVYIGNAYFNRPGPRLVESLEILCAIVHPHDFEDLRRKHAASVLDLATARRIASPRT